MPWEKSPSERTGARRRPGRQLQPFSQTGRAEKVRAIQGPDTPLARLGGFRITPDGRSWAYGYTYQIPSRKDLFVVSGMMD